MWAIEKNRQTSPDKVQERTTGVPVDPVYSQPTTRQAPPPKTPHREYILTGLRQCPFMIRKQTVEEKGFGGSIKKTQTVSFEDCLGERCSAFRITKAIGDGGIRCTCLRLERSAYDEYTAKKVYADEPDHIVH